MNTLAKQAEHNLDDRDSFAVAIGELEKLCADFYRYHNAIIGLINAEAFNGEDDIRKVFDSMVLAIKTIHFKVQKAAETSEPPSVASALKSNIKLPKVELPSFSGDITTFVPFMDMFNNLIHKSSDLTAVEKFNYLLSALKGEARALIENLPVTDSNYLTAYSALHNRYKNDRQILQAHWIAIDNAPKIHSEHPQELRTLIDTFSTHLKAIRNFTFPIDLADFVLFNVMLQKLDSSLITRFELHHNSKEIPTYHKLYQFLEHQWSALGNAIPVKPQQKKLGPHKPFTPQPRFTTSLVAKSESLKCPVCTSPHVIYKCLEFLGKSARERDAISKSKHLCLNCLSNCHVSKACQSTHSCRHCGKGHHSLLHFEAIPSGDCQVPNSAEATSIKPMSGVGFASPAMGFLLAAALIEVRNNSGNSKVLRALLDCGSQSSFISQQAFQSLGLSRRNTSGLVQGLGQVVTAANLGSVIITFRPVGQLTLTFKVNALILPKICEDLPCASISAEHWSHFRVKLPLADPSCVSGAGIDMLLGADVYSQLLSGEVVKGQKGEPDALGTALGHVLVGQHTASTANTNLHSFITTVNTCCELERSIQKLWEVEAVPRLQTLSPDEELCEDIYNKTYTRTDKGRFVVSLPFRDTPPTFKDSRSIAINRFLHLEAKLLKQPQLYAQYSKFMQEYLEFNHMEPVLHPDDTIATYYIPHHCVLKPASLSTKLRVVFKASARSSNQTSLNEHLLIGSKLQRDICTILLNFRLHTYVLTANIKMMYRQILINPDNRLKTLTYGTFSAPYLAIRTLLKLSEQDGSSFPLAAAALQTDTYMDDIVTGNNSYQQTLTLKHELIALLKGGGFELRKWATNDSSLVSDLPPSHVCLDAVNIREEDRNDTLRILGLQWNPVSDAFKFTVHILPGKCTKRHLLSSLARIFDPLGILTPLTFFIKHLIQRIWSLKLAWDDAPPNDILRVWNIFARDLSVLNDFSLPRRLLCDNFLSCEIHGFADSSEKGYAAVVYLVFTFASLEPRTQFVCAKSKVAPLKKITIPRLELSAAVLLTRLLNLVCRIYKDKIPFNRLCAWTDSQIVLAWIKSSPHRWKTFVSNRVSFIQEHLLSSSWYYVPSGQNPADLGSRGAYPQELLVSSLWWAGPSFLKFGTPLNNMTPSVPVSIQDEERTQSCNAIVTTSLLDDLVNTHSSLPKIIRILCYVRRFIRGMTRPTESTPPYITSSEWSEALMTVVRHIQALHFSREIDFLKRGKPLPKGFQNLSPFLDDQKILRVGGRLRQGLLPYSKRFPALSGHRFTSMLIEYTHRKYLHAGHQTVHYLLVSKMFPYPTGIHSTTHGGFASFSFSQIKPFLRVGVDYAGPFSITMAKTRGAKTLKAYLCLFICFATKALHLELVSDLTADAFLAALRPFLARRGRCQHIYSDCAVQSEQIHWHFNPPSTPHFGGLWKAGVKSVKTHLVRVIGHQILTYEELFTLVSQVEAMLNSRPLHPVSSDPNDLTALTPGHFLTFSPLIALPEPDLADMPVNRLTRWQLVQSFVKCIWSRWSAEYLHTLHQRSKWSAERPNSIAVGSLVLIKNELIPPLQWRLALVLLLHPGQDGIVRVVTLKTAGGVLKRPVAKLCPLPATLHLSLSFGPVLRPQPSLHWWPVYCGPFSFGVRLCSNQSSGLDAFSSCRSRTGNDITRHIIVPAIADSAIIIPAIVEPAIVEPLQPAKMQDPYYAHPFRVLSPGAPQPSPPGQDHSGRIARIKTR
ncbi:uncharacterized protein LOC135131147 [Zophobas morio]|uniref:uncharacterized protein LOC135131147 n=1 Tax=Zophobas morio TaxID=2755281 RepID=UPI003082749B